MVQIKQNLVSPSKYNIKCPHQMEAKYVTIHNTANDAPAENEINYMISNNKEVSFHIAVDDVEAIQGLPLDRNAWASGDGNGPGNRSSIHVEICYSKSSGERYKKAEENAIKLVAQMLKERGWGIDRVKKHQDWSNKYCPHRILDEGRWNQVLNAIETELKGQAVASPNQPVSGGTGSIVDYLKSIGQDSSFANRANLAKQHGIVNYQGTAAQNTELLNKLKQGQSVQSQPAPVSPQSTPDAKRTIYLPASAPTWTVYKLDRPAVKANPANIAGTLKPAKFGGLSYEILNDLGGWVFEIQAANFGRVKIYGHPSTGAVIK